MDDRRRTATGPVSLQRVSSLAALVSDPDNVNWAALWIAWIDLHREAKGSEMEIRVAQLVKLIQLEDAKGLVAELVALAAESTSDHVFVNKTTTLAEQSTDAAEAVPDEPLPAEQRRHYRLPTNLKVEVSWLDGFGFQNDAPAVIKNASAAGFGIELDRQLVLGSRLTLRTEASEIRCVVRHIQSQEERFYVGVEILPEPSDSKAGESPSKDTEEDRLTP